MKKLLETEVQNVAGGIVGLITVPVTPIAAAAAVMNAVKSATKSDK